MTKRDRGPADPMTPMDEASAAMREQYLSLRRAGFTWREAVEMVARLVSLAQSEDDDGGEGDG